MRRIELEPWSGARELDMAAAPVFRPAPVEPPRIALAFRALDPAGAPLAVDARVRWQGPVVEDEDPAADAARFRLPAGVRYEASFEAEGHVTVFRVGRARESLAPEEVRLLRDTAVPAAERPDGAAPR